MDGAAPCGGRARHRGGWRGAVAGRRRVEAVVAAAGAVHVEAALAVGELFSPQLADVLGEPALALGAEVAVGLAVADFGLVLRADLGAAGWHGEGLGTWGLVGTVNEKTMKTVPSSTIRKPPLEEI